MAAGKMRTILLARHGETEWNRIGRWQGNTDIPLSETGRVQARSLGERLAGQGVMRVYSSHLSRAKETAQIVAATLGLQFPVAVDPRLRERGYGCFEGLTREECAERHSEAWQRYLGDRRAVPPDAEPQSEIVTRVTEAMRDVALSATGDMPVVVVSHGGAIRSFVHAAIGVLVSPPANGAIIRVSFDGDSFSLAPEPPT